MAFHVRAQETDILVRRLSARTGKGLTDIIHALAKKELERLDDIDRQRPLAERIAPIIARINARKKIDDGMTDKEFWDDLSGDY